MKKVLKGHFVKEQVPYFIKSLLRRILCINRYIDQLLSCKYGWVSSVESIGSVQICLASLGTPALTLKVLTVFATPVLQLHAQTHETSREKCRSLDKFKLSFRKEKENRTLFLHTLFQVSVLAKPHTLNFSCSRATHTQ